MWCLDSERLQAGAGMVVGSQLPAVLAGVLGVCQGRANPGRHRL